MGQSFYITTPIYYPSGKLHIGHSYTTVAADVMARYKRMRGFDVMFLTGTDEHGQKIQRKAEEVGVTPKAYVDEIVAGIRDLWSVMNISYDRFIRTTDAQHEKAVQHIFQKLYDQGDIYKGEYSGWYCTPCEAFWTETQLVDGNCPDCGRPVEKTSEEAYFFRLSAYQDRLIRYLEENPEFLQPTTRVNEMLANFLRPGLEDLCVSRTTFDWGVRVPFDPAHVVYVWVDALSNYITAMGWPDNTDDGYNQFWPADIHLVGKEIVRFHAIIWPAILMALGLPMPKQVYGHGWLLLQDGKMSKSKGNVVDPVVLCDRYGVDAIRYFLLREIAFGQDGHFSNEALVKRINSDLANDLGNLLSRTVAMVDRYFGGTLPDDRRVVPEEDDDLLGLCRALPGAVSEQLDALQYGNALSEIWKVIGRSNKYIDETTPWILAKDEEQKDRLAAVLYHLADSLRIVSVVLQPFLPDTTARMRTALGIPEDTDVRWDAACQTGLYTAPDGVRKEAPLFPRLDPEEELKAMEALTGTPAEPVAEEKPEEKEPEWIGFDDFTKVKMVVGKVLECEKQPKSDRLLKSRVDTGSEIRTILSGIAEYYTPEDMVGKTVVVAANLKPRKIMGVLSEGMLLASEEADGTLRLLTVDGDTTPGAVVG